MKNDVPLNIRHLGGNLMAIPDTTYDNNGKIISYNIDPIIKELEQQADLYVGNGERLCAHYALTLPNEEKLDEMRWSMAARSYMSDMGYGDDTKWTAVIHDDTEAEHLHIIACRVRFDRSLVNDKNDFERGIRAVRKIEKYLGLVVNRSPEENFGIEYSIAEMRTGHGRGTEAAYRDPGHIIRSGLEMVFHNTPKTMLELVVSLREHNVMSSVYRDKGRPTGIRYSVDGKTWISGTKIKRQRATWGKLIEQGIDYHPQRDDKWLNLGACDINNNAKIYYLSALIHCTEKQYKRIKKPLKRYVYKPKGLPSQRLIQLDFVTINDQNLDKTGLANLLTFLLELLASIFKMAVFNVFDSLNPAIPNGFLAETINEELRGNTQNILKTFDAEQARNDFIKDNEWVNQWSGNVKERDCDSFCELNKQ